VVNIEALAATPDQPSTQSQDPLLELVVQLPANEPVESARSHEHQLRGMNKQRRGSRDRIALTTWPNGRDAKVHSTLQLEWDRASKAHSRIAPITLVAYAFAQALKQNPMANRRVVLWKIRPHNTVGISFAVDEGDDLRIAVIQRADELNPKQFQHALRIAARDARRGVGPLARCTRIVSYLPVVAGRPLLRIWSLLTAGLGIPMLGVPGAPFGAVLLSSVERFGLPAANVPLVPFTRCAFVCSVGAVTQSLVVRAGAVAVADVVELSVSIDHRICDASQLASFLEAFEAAFYE
jgi:pyruvate/2-oxoglutarate dehydrogenase complex dihydrolipoamide acyltransferase (E2) component